MKNLYNKRGSRIGGGERHPFAFFAIGTIVILAAVFVIGLQVGRVVEKNAVTGIQSPEAKGAAQEARTTGPGGPGNDIRKDLGAFSEDAAKLPVVPPPDAKGAVDEVEKRITFQESLPRKEDKPLPLAPASPSDGKGVSGTAGAATRKYAIQAGAFRDPKAAETCRRKLEKAGYAVRTIRYEDRKTGKRIHRVLLGPFSDKATAHRTAVKLKEKFQIHAFVTPG